MKKYRIFLSDTESFWLKASAVDVRADSIVFYGENEELVAFFFHEKIAGYTCEVS